ncbi:MAG: YggT family protein [Thermoleophilaceae bacterium]|jgi:YggT family protein|nr:YggT family protein [Thermoleophilaceae bacterium]
MSSVVIAAITRNDVGRYVYTLAVVFVVLIFIRILLSWFRLPYSRWLNMFLEFLTEVTDPYLNLWRRFLPLVRLGPGAIDLSPIIGTIVLLLVASIVSSLIAG